MFRFGPLLVAMLGTGCAISQALAADATPPVAPAVAAPAHYTVDFTATLPGLGGKPLPNPRQATEKDPGCEHCDLLTLSDVVVEALLFTLPGDEPAPSPMGAPQKMTDAQGAQTVARGMLAIRIDHNPAAVLSARERDVIIGRIEARWRGLVPAVAVGIIDPDAKELTASVDK